MPARRCGMRWSAPTRACRYRLAAGRGLTRDPVLVFIAKVLRIAVSVRCSGVAAPAAHLPTVAGRHSNEHNRVGRSSALATTVRVYCLWPGHIVGALGVSITDGSHASPESFTGWPQQLAARFATLPDDCNYGVVDAGMRGNRLLRNGAGLRMIGATLPPYRNSAHYTPTADLVRHRVSHRMQTRIRAVNCIPTTSAMRHRRGDRSAGATTQVMSYHPRDSGSDASSQCRRSHL